MSPHRICKCGQWDHFTTSKGGLPLPTLCGGRGVTLPPGVVTQDLLYHGLAGQDAGLQLRDAPSTAELAVLQGFLGLQLPTNKQHIGDGSGGV